MKLYPPKYRQFLLTVAMIGFTISGFAIRSEQPFLGWMGIVFGILGAILFLLQLLPASAFLELKDEGLRYRIFFQNNELLWSKVNKFKSVTMRDGKTQRIGWYYTKQARAELNLPDPGKEPFPDGFLPELYGKKAEELLDLLQNARRKAKGIQGKSSQAKNSG